MNKVFFILIKNAKTERTESSVTISCDITREPEFIKCNNKALIEKIGVILQ